MAQVELRLLTLNDREKFFESFNDEWEDHFDFVGYWDTLAGKSFDKYVEIAPEFIEGKHIPDDHVPGIFLFAFNRDGDIVGRTSIRFELTEQLLKVGGHIGYGVCPRFRKQGYATAILEESLKYVRENLPELKKVLVTCNEDNIASKKTIERNGGVLENIIDAGKSVRTMRYWIILA